jgi:hypothetical protein
MKAPRRGTGPRSETSQPAMIRPFRLALLAAAVSAATACSPAPTTPPVSAAAPATSSAAASSAAATPTPSAPDSAVSDTAAGFTFERPASWVVWQPNQHSPMTGGPMAYLSTDPLIPACAVAPSASPNPPDATGFACAWPLDELKPGGVLAMWETSRILQRLPTAGPIVETNGAKARWEASTPGECSAVGADETIVSAVPIAQPTPLSNVAFVACLRGPGLASSEAAVRALLASARLGP